MTEGLEPESSGGEEARPWGRWLRLIDVAERRGNTLMTGIDGRPLLVLDRVGEGRVALMASDHAWLWSRGYDGGGPQLELLRRLAHWMMGEPDLEEEALTATAEGQTMTLVRRTLGGEAGDVEITAPDGTVSLVPLEEMAPGRFSATFEGPEIGLYTLAEGDEETVIAHRQAQGRVDRIVVGVDQVVRRPGVCRICGACARDAPPRGAAGWGSSLGRPTLPPTSGSPLCCRPGRSC